MDENQETSGAKVSLGEYIVVLQILAIFELTDLGDATIVLKLISLAGTGAYFIYSYQRGLPNGVALIAAAADAFPIIGWLPMRMAGYTVAVVMANNPKIAQVAGAAGKLAVVAGVGVATGGTGAAASGAAAAGESAAGATTAAGATSAGTAAGGVTTQTATGTTTSTAGGATSAQATASASQTTSSAAQSAGSATPATTGRAQLAEEVQKEQDPMLQLNKQLMQQSPGATDRPSGGRDDVAVDDDTNAVQLPYTA
jgi:type IV secretory pathway TrbL component